MAFNKGFGNSVISLPHETVLWTWGGGSVVDIWGSQQCSLMMTLLFLLVVFFFPLLSFPNSASVWMSFGSRPKNTSHKT